MTAAPLDPDEADRRGALVAVGAAVVMSSAVEFTYAHFGDSAPSLAYAASAFLAFFLLSLGIAAPLRHNRVRAKWALALWVGFGGALMEGLAAGALLLFGALWGLGERADDGDRPTARAVLPVPPVAKGVMAGGLLALVLLVLPHGAGIVGAILVLPFALRSSQWVFARTAPRLSAVATTVLFAALCVVLSAKPWGALGFQPLVQGAGFGRPPAAAESVAERKPNVFVLVLDTVRADHLSIYGYHRPTTPRLAEHLARRPDARIYPYAFSNGTWTVPSHATLFTGLLASEHGADYGSALARGFAIDAPATLAERYAERGWLTACVFANFWLARVRGLERGFQRYEYVPHALGLPLFGERLRARFAPSLFGHEVIGGALATEVNTAILDAVDQAAGRPLFLVANYTDPHAPYVPPPPFRGTFAPWSPFETPRSLAVHLPAPELDRLKARYDEEITSLDHSLGELFDALERRGVLADAWVVVTSDHGEAFGEHGVTEHGTTVHNEVTRVPLVVFPPPGVDLPQQDAPVSLVDVAATLAAICGGSPLGRGDDLRQPLSLTRTTTLEFFGDPSKAPQHGPLALEPAQVVIRGAHKLIQYIGRAELYDLSLDVGERVDLAGTKPDLVEILAPLLPEWEMRPPKLRDWSRVLPRADLERLRSMGYLGEG